MPTNIIADTTELALLTKVVDQYCQSHTILVPEAREAVGRRVLGLFGQGFHTEAALTSRLAQSPNMD